MPSAGAAQSRQRHGAATTGRQIRPARPARVSSIRSMSSRNFRNMIQVSIGSRSRSPFSPLSLRMIWRADLMMRSSRWAVVSGLATPRLRVVKVGTLILFRYNTDTPIAQEPWGSRCWEHGTSAKRRQATYRRRCNSATARRNWSPPPKRAAISMTLPHSLSGATSRISGSLNWRRRARRTSQ